MGRPKGSKNKKTLERERLEASLKSNLEAQISIQESQVEDLPLREEESTPDEQKLEIESLNTIQDLPNEETEVEEQPKTSKKKTSPSKPKCERCGVEIDSEPYKIDTNVLTGRADYFRESTRYVKLCGKCSMELSKIVDNFLLSGECSEGIRKFPTSSKDQKGYKPVNPK